jgi:hypothetical protein
VRGFVPESEHPRERAAARKSPGPAGRLNDNPSCLGAGVGRLMRMVRFHHLASLRHGGANPTPRTMASPITPARGPVIRAERGEDPRRDG